MTQFPPCLEFEKLFQHCVPKLGRLFAALETGDKESALSAPMTIRSSDFRELTLLWEVFDSYDDDNSSSTSTVYGYG